MPHLDESFLAPGDDQLFAFVEDGIEYLAIGFQVGVGCVSKHGLDV